MLLPQLHFLELAQAAQPHVENRLGLAVGEAEFLHHRRLGLVFGADDCNHPVEIEEGDDVARDDFEPQRNLVEPVPGAPLENVDLARDPVRQQLPQAHHHRGAGRVEHVEVEREARFEIGQL